MYRDDQGNFKGEALVIYFKEESVKLACDLLDEAPLRFSEKELIRVQPAVFQEKPEIKEKKVHVEKHVLKAKMTKMSKFVFSLLFLKRG